jgi:hypothetical protein
LRIAVCTKNDLFGAIVLNRVLPALASHDVGLFMSNRDRTELDDSIPQLDLMRMMERQVPLDIVFPLLDAHPPAPGRALTPKQLAAQAGCALTLIDNMRPDGGTATIEAFGADLILSIRFSYLFRRSTIARTPGGIINVHPGPLPAYRGLYAPFWQMIRGNEVLRCTVHLVDAGIDTGPVLSIEEVKLVPGRSMFWHATQLYLAGAARAVAYIRDGLPEAATQDPALAGKNDFPSPEDFARFAAAGFSLIRGGDYRDLLRPFVACPPGQGA